MKDDIVYYTIPYGDKKNPKEAVVIVDFDNMPKVLMYYWFIEKAGSTFSAVSNYVNGQRVSMHRLLTGAEPGDVVHHKNGNGLDNRRCNLGIFNSLGDHSLHHHALKGHTNRKGRKASILVPQSVTDNM
jgi:hypothetical protein